MVLNKFLFFGLSKASDEHYSELSAFLENIKLEYSDFKFQFITKRPALVRLAKAFQKNSPDRFVIFVDEPFQDDISELHAEFLTMGIQAPILSLNFNEPDFSFLKNRLFVEESFSANMQKLSEQITTLSKANSESEVEALNVEIKRQAQLLAERDQKIRELESALESMQSVNNVDIDVCETAEYKALSETCDKLKHRMDFILSDNESVILRLNAEIAEKDAEIAKLKDVPVTEVITGSELYQTLKASNDDLQNQLKQLTPMVEKLRGDLSAIEEEKSALSNQILELTDTLAAKEDEVKALQNESENQKSEAQAETETLTQQISQLNGLLTEKDCRIEELTKDLDNRPVTEDYERVLADVKQLKESLTAKEKDYTKNLTDKDNLISELKQSLTGKDSEIEKLKQDVSDKVTEISTQAQQLAEANAIDTDGLNAQIEELTNALSAKETEITELQKTVSDELAQKDEEYQKSIEVKDRAFNDVQAELETLRQDFANLQAEHALQSNPEITDEDVTGSELYKNLESKLGEVQGLLVEKESLISSLNETISAKSEVSDEEVQESLLYKNLESKMNEVQSLLAEKESLISSLNSKISEPIAHEISDEEIRESLLYKDLEAELSKKDSEILELKDRTPELTDTAILSSKLYKDLLSEKVSLGLQLENQVSGEVDVTGTPEYKSLLAEKDKLSAELQEALLSALNGGAELTEESVKESVWYQNLAVSERSLVTEVDALKQQVTQLESALSDTSAMSVQLRNLRIEKESLNSSLKAINNSLMYNSFTSQACSFTPLANVCAYTYGSELGRNILINRLLASLKNKPSKFVIFDLSSDLKYSSIFQSQASQFLDSNTSIDVLFNESYKGVSLASMLQSQSRIYRYSVFNGFTFMTPNFFASLFERLSSLVSEGYTVIFLLNSIMDTSVQYFLKNFSSFGMTSVTLKADLKVSLYACISILRFINLPKSSTIYLVDTFENSVLQSLDKAGRSIVNNFMQEHPSVICNNSQQQAEIEKISLFNCERV